MYDWEDKIIYLIGAIFFIVVLATGGFHILSHPVMLSGFIGVVVFVLFYLLSFIYRIRNGKSPKKKSKLDNKTVMPKPDNKVVIPKNRKPIE
jgi:predicted membrane channel-forming protein YqfA (hemolysin III family)